MSKWIAEFELEDGDTMPEHMDLEYKGVRIDFHCKPQEPTAKNNLVVDCISRQIISDYVESHIQEINTGYGDLNRHTNSILRMIVNYIENMPSVTPQEPRWIPVSERLPEPYQNILVTIEDFHWENEPVRYSVRQKSFNGSVNFVAWMPLPKAYREVEE